jgi:hypothetical protein
MAILRIRDSNGNIQEILAIKGEKGDTGAKGEKGDKGDSYILTPDDKTEIANQISASAQVLPSVTADDNGKFLQVIDGAWGAVAVTDAEGVEY